MENIMIELASKCYGVSVSFFSNDVIDAGGRP